MTGRGSRRRRQRGQILPIAVAAFVLILGCSALVMDVGNIYFTQRAERTITDTAALAGAQQLPRTPTAAHYTAARTVAMENVIRSLNNTPANQPTPTMPDCGYGSDIVRCPVPGLPYMVSIVTPTPYCIECFPEQAIMVSLTRMQLPAYFARVFGYEGWDVTQTSVAGPGFAGKYAIITLRPPRPIAAYTADANREDIFLDGTDTVLQVLNADIGTNTDADGNGSIFIENGFRAWHYDTWWPFPSVPERQIPHPRLIQDPNYAYPYRPSAPVFNTASAGEEDAATCTSRLASIPDNYLLGATPIKTLTAGPTGKVHCYRPGIYLNGITNNNNDEVVLLDSYGSGTVGVFFFDDAGLHSGLNVSGGLIGGYRAGEAGISLVFATCRTSQCQFNGTNAQMIALNAGTKYRNTAGTEAGAAIGFDGNRVRTAANASPPLQPLTIMVRHDPSGACHAIWDPAAPGGGEWVQYANCDANLTIKIAGGGNVYMAGLQYAPTDNIVFTGGATGMGYVGQIVGWTVKYAGGTKIMQAYPPGPENGVLRLDTACTGTNVPAACFP